MVIQMSTRVYVYGDVYLSWWYNWVSKRVYAYGNVYLSR